MSYGHSSEITKSWILVICGWILYWSCKEMVTFNVELAHTDMYNLLSVQDRKEFENQTYLFGGAALIGAGIVIYHCFLILKNCFTPNK